MGNPLLQRPTFRPVSPPKHLERNVQVLRSCDGWSARALSAPLGGENKCGVPQPAQVHGQAGPLGDGTENSRRPPRDGWWSQGRILPWADDTVGAW